MARFKLHAGRDELLTFGALDSIEIHIRIFDERCGLRLGQAHGVPHSSCSSRLRTRASAAGLALWSCRMSAQKLLTSSITVFGFSAFALLVLGFNLSS